MQSGVVVGDRFVVEAYAGAGGMGAVYRARDTRTGDVVALKVLAEGGNDRRFKLEAELLAELEHPAIVRYVAHGETRDGQSFLAMEWLDGEDLRTTLATRRLTMAEVRAAAIRVAEALAAAHVRGVVHRDIKPANLFLPGGDVARLKVLDFGIARTSRAGVFESTQLPMTRTGVVMGTVGYMSPEQASGETRVDTRADTFALGCVLFECITGKPAFSGPNAFAVLAKVLLEESPRPRLFEPSVPPDLDELVSRMLAKDPSNRPRDAMAILRSLEPTDVPSLRSSGGIGDREQRLVTIVLVRNVELSEALRATLPHVVRLADGAFLVEVLGHEPATEAATTALGLAREFPNAELSIATGRISRQTAAYGPIIDRLAALPRPARGIAIDEVSAVLLGDRFEVRDGALLGAATRSALPRLLLGRPTPCVGRDKELALLEATFRECESDAVSRAVLVTAPAGAGKSRLCHEVLARVGRDVRVLVARADPMSAGASLGLAKELVRAAAELDDRAPSASRHERLRAHLDRFFSGDALDRAAELLGELVGAPAPSPSPQLRAVRDDAPTRAKWIAKSFADWIAALADEGPVLAVVEDLHWGDGASVAYLADALVANQGRPLMVLALARPCRARPLPEPVGPRRRPGDQALRRSRSEPPRSSCAPRSGTLRAKLVSRIVERLRATRSTSRRLVRHVAARASDTLPESLLALAEARHLAPRRRGEARPARRERVRRDVLERGALGARRR
ncbi:MAG: protein kinase [Polyangiaceae bacterium]